MKRLLLLLLSFILVSPAHAELRIIKEKMVAIVDEAHRGDGLQMTLDGFDEASCVVAMCSNQFVKYSHSVDSSAFAIAAPYHLLNGLEPITINGYLRSWVQVTVTALSTPDEHIEPYVNALADLFFMSDSLIGFVKKSQLQFNDDSGMRFIFIPTVYSQYEESPISKGFMWGISDKYWFMFRMFHIGGTSALESLARSVADQFIRSNLLLPHPTVALSAERFNHIYPPGESPYGMTQAFLGYPKTRSWFAASMLACGGLNSSVDDTISFVSAMRSDNHLLAKLWKKEIVTNPLFDDYKSLRDPPKKIIRQYYETYQKNSSKETFCDGMRTVWKNQIKDFQSDMKLWFSRDGDTEVYCIYPESKRPNDNPLGRIMTNHACLKSEGHAFLMNLSKLWFY